YERIDDRLRTWNRTDGVGRQHLDQRVEEGRIAAGRGTLLHDEADGVIYVHPLLETEAMRRRIAVVNDRIPDQVPRAFVLPQEEVHAVPAAPVQIVDLAADPDVAREGALPETRNRLIARRRCIGPDLLVRPRSLPMVAGKRHLGPAEPGRIIVSEEPATRPLGRGEAGVRLEIEGDRDRRGEGPEAVAVASVQLKAEVPASRPVWCSDTEGEIARLVLHDGLARTEADARRPPESRLHCHEA